MAAGNWISFEGRKYVVAPGERALDAMLRQGAPVKFSCRKGTCRSCMLQAASGDPGPEAVERLPQDLRELGFFLPCCATNVDQVDAKTPDLSLCTHEAVLSEKTFAAPDILVLKFELVNDTPWQAGQLIGLMNDAGDVRSYSIVSLKNDYLLEIHVRIYKDGKVSSWAADVLKTGQTVRFQGPSGDFIYNATNMADRPLVLVGTGTGAGVLFGLVRQALADGHMAPIHLYLGGRKAQDLYLGDRLNLLPADKVTIVQAASREDVGGQPARRITDVAFDEQKDLTESNLFICGAPDMVETARVRAMAAGASLDRIYADPFDAPEPYKTNEVAKLTSLKPDLELWEALGKGQKLSVILNEFYTAVYEDPQLAPFFHRVTKQRAVEKQYNFLQDILSGTKLYFGEKPFNAHHWMVISNELFDYRERLFFNVVRRYGISEKLIHRWSAIHELFRRDIVKSAARGILRDGEEVHLEGFTREKMDIASVCDGCMEEINAGDEVLMHSRTGEVFCVKCEAKDVEEEFAA